MKREIVDSYLYEAWNQAEHAHRLVECARADFRRGEFDSALGALRQAKGPAAILESLLDDATMAVEKHRATTTNPAASSATTEE